MPTRPQTPSSDAFLAAIVSSSRDAIISKDLDSNITSWNKGAERMFRYTAAEAIGQPINILFPPDRADEEPGILARIRRGEAVETYDTVRRRKDGSLVDISLTVSPIFGPDGAVIGASKIARDISRLKRAEEKLRVTLSSIGDAVIATDPEGRIEFMNRTAEELTGWRELEARGQDLDRVFAIVSEGSRRPVDSPIAIALRERRVVALANHTVLIAKDQRERPIDDSAAPIIDASRNLLGGVLVFRDVSHRRDAELAALRLAAIVDGSDDAIVSKDLNGIVTTWNPAAERIFGYSPAEMIGQSITKIIPANRLDEETQILNRLRRGDRIDHFRTVRRRKDGALIHVSLTISPMRDREGHIVGRPRSRGMSRCCSKPRNSSGLMRPSSRGASRNGRRNCSRPSPSWRRFPTACRTTCAHRCGRCTGMPKRCSKTTQSRRRRRPTASARSSRRRVGWIA